MSAIKDKVRAAVVASGLSLDQTAVDRLADYFQLLRTWNRRLNLVGFDLEASDPGAIRRILVEPLVAAARLPRVHQMIDVGSGGGSPGIPMALALGVVRLDLVESRARKATFLREAMRVCRLNGTVLGVRFEDLPAGTGMPSYDLLTVRAVRLDHPFWEQASRVLRPAAMLGWFHGPSQELPAGETRFAVSGSIDLGAGADLAVLRRC